ncbi:uncharacterized protein LOC119446481 [Dermacentor silvarum]|uniref:uncharacterized protein LOC119446481 n=1 Tax=Dermacentor silvarum TaxID=543639 RepID=UPI00189A03B4|nr:uncharacterized protein LOC119446481 [Dermacentor silvarum]
MYQVLPGILAAAAFIGGAAAESTVRPWMTATAHMQRAPPCRPLMRDGTPDTFLLELQPGHMPARRGTLPDPLYQADKREHLGSCRLGCGTLLGTNLRCFMYQVGYLNYAKCYRTSNVMLVRVSCPIDRRMLCLFTCSVCKYVVDSAWLLIFNDCSLLGEALLLLSGDVELNPGPMNVTEREQMANIEKILLDVQTGQATVLAKLAEIVSKQTELEQKIDSVIAKSNVIEERIKVVEESERKIEAKIDDLENRSRRLNLVFYGVPDNERKETWEKSENLVKDICSDVLKLDNIPIERAHRLGAFTEGRIRPIVTSFSGWKARESVMRNAFKFKNTSFSVSEDFSHAVREKRRLLWNYAKEKRDSKEYRVRLNYDKLIINGKTFVWDSEMNQLTPLRAHTRSQRAD